MNETRGTNSVRVKIHDREYALRTDSDPERLHELCAALDERMRDIAVTTGSVDTIRLAVLTALSLADEARRAREEMMKLDEAVGKRSIACISLLDRSIS